MTTDNFTAHRDVPTQNDFLIDLFCRVNDMMTNVKKHSQAKLYPSEVVTFALKGRGPRAFYVWAAGFMP